MKTELSKIAQDLEQGRIDETEARTFLLGLLGVSGSFFCHINKGCLTPNKFPKCDGCLYLIKNEH